MGVEDVPVVGLLLHFRTPQRSLACLYSLLDGGIQRAVVVDNSEDGGRSITEMAGGFDDLRRNGMNLVLVPSGRNLGFARGVAAGIEWIMANAPGHVLLINSDAKIEGGSLACMRKELGQAGVVAPYARSNEGVPPVSPIVFYQPLWALYLRRPGRFRLAYPSGTCLLIRNDVLGPDFFDRDFFFYGEDVKLGHDLVRRGIGFVECAHAVVSHEGSASSKNGSMFYEYHMNRAHWLLGYKLAYSGLGRIVFTAARCVALPLRALIRSFRFHSLIPWKALIAATFDVVIGRCRSFTPPSS